MLRFRRIAIAPSFAAVLLLASCSPEEVAEEPSARGRAGEQPIAVEVAIAQAQPLIASVEYIGTTQPARTVLLRAQVEGRLLSLSADVGDRVRQGQVLARLDDALLIAALNEAQAEVAVREAELGQSRAQVAEARTALERAKVELTQARNDAERYTELAAAGAVTQREAETFQTAVKVAEQGVRSAEERVQSELKAITAATGRIAAQRAVVAQDQQRLTYTRLLSPLNGVVLERRSEPGNLVTPGGEVLALGDFSQVKVVVPVSELDLATLRVGQPVQVRLDALGDRRLEGRLSRLAPIADAQARQVSVEIALPNPGGQIGGGLLARVTFSGGSREAITLPASALQAREGQNPLVFVVSDPDDNRQAQVEAREVTTSPEQQGQVEILSGLRPGDRVAIRSAQPLAPGDRVRVSILSEL